MNQKQLKQQMNAEQFAAFDTQLYLDTHPNDGVALQMLDNYHKNFQEYKKQYSADYGSVSSDDRAAGDRWSWLDNPWPWEREAN